MDHINRLQLGFKQFGSDIQKNGVTNWGWVIILAWKWLHKLRRAMVRIGRDKLNDLLEVNETSVVHGTTRSRLSHWSAVEDNENKKFVFRSLRMILALASHQRLLIWLKKVAAYARMAGMVTQDYGYKHLPITNENIAEEDVISLAHLLASLLKRWLLGTHQAIDHKNLPYYLDDFPIQPNLPFQRKAILSLSAAGNRDWSRTR